MLRWGISHPEVTVPVLRDILFSVNVEALLEAPRRKQGRGRPGAMKDTAEKALLLGKTLFSPAALYDEFEVGGLAGERVELPGDGVGLTIGPKSDLLAMAKRVVVAVYTIGPELDAEVTALQRAGEPFLAYLLDCVGVMALGHVGERMRRFAEELALGLEWGVSQALSPGSLVGWALQGQRELCGLLPLADIGVRLNKYCVLEPQKTGSMLIGLGPDYETHEVGSICGYCALKDSCWRRKEKNTAEPQLE